MKADADTLNLKVPLISMLFMPSEEKVKDAEKPPTNASKKTLKFEEVGIWTVMREVDPKTSWRLPIQSVVTRGKQLVAIFPFIYRFVHECYSVSPWMMIVYLVSSLWSSTEDAVNIYFSSRLLNLIQDSVTNRHLNGKALITTVISRLAFTLASTIVTSPKTVQVLSTRIRYLFEKRVIAANLRLDMPAFEEPETTEKINRYLSSGGGGVWDRFEDLVSKVRVFTSVISQLSLLFGVLSSQPGGYWFAVICLAKSIFDIFSYTSVWDTKWLKARTCLGDISDDSPDRIIRTNRSLLLAFADSALEDFPLIFYAFQVFFQPQNFSLTSIALMQQVSTNLTWTLYDIFRDSRSMQQLLQQIKEIYDIGNIPNKLEDGDLKYPDTAISRGMEIKFENVSFTYPTAKDSDAIIKDVSFTIGNGQTVVIVGVNGSGKSTLLKLFNRLYDPTSGTISIDDVPLRSFVAADVRRSMAMLYQTYTHFPLSIRENIALGIPDEDNDVASLDEKKRSIRDDRIKEAARLGGSLELIEKQTQGLDTVLQPSVRSWSTSTTDAGQDFKDKVTEIGKQAEVSAGQWQRLALSRLFYRSFHEPIRLVAVDEPSASLDPKMEYELFERLRSLSTAQGKTMVYVTHRFGYLTKRADLILVMHQGELVEQGRHSDLLARDGEYAKLYKLQAEAFTPDEEGTDPAL
ncbi:P-loop containing nucleoside triphosphate hydrolase protein [Hysterangium stoloniferum]|nr:P-loop containing nucleoside triphosphate hydrolase protein [Hysterangium stoloniferum]